MISTARELSARLLLLHACPESIMWVSSYPADTPIEKLYAECTRPAWMLWILSLGDTRGYWKIREKIQTIRSVSGPSHGDEDLEIANLVRSRYTLAQFVECLTNAEE